MEADDSYVYMNNAGVVGGGRIARVGINGGAVTNLTPPQGIVDLTQDENYVYWGTTSGEILKVAK